MSNAGKVGASESWRRVLRRDSLLPLAMFWGCVMSDLPGFWCLEHHLAELFSERDPLEMLAATVDIDILWPVLSAAACRSGSAKGWRPGFDAALKFKLVSLQAFHGLSLQQTSYLVWKRLSWMRFCGLRPGDRWTVRTSKDKHMADGAVQADVAILVFGYKSLISIDHRHGIIRRDLVRDATAVDGPRLREGLIDPANTASDVRAVETNQTYLADHGKASRIHRKKLAGKPMSKTTAQGNALISKIRARFEHVLTVQKDRMSLFIRTNGRISAVWPTGRRPHKTGAGTRCQQNGA